MDRKPNILAVDDSRTMRGMLQHVLVSAGFNVETAEDGVDGLEKLEDKVPDLIISDINMPRLDGFGFVEGVRSKSEFRGIPILILTTESAPEMKDRARRAGASGWIVKPFDEALLVGAIRKVLAH
jgi:two-component system chemotaxis response regulator CheY